MLVRVGTSHVTGLTMCLIPTCDLMLPGLWVQCALLVPTRIGEGMEQGSSGDADGLQSRIL